MKQFPVAFEFNNFFLKALAFHTTTNRFFDWLLDCDADRVACGLLQFDALEIEKTSEPVLFWDFVDRQWESSPIYCNFLYDAQRSHNLILNPKCALPYLHIWDYFHGQTLSDDLTYDVIPQFSTTSSTKHNQDNSEILEKINILVDAAFQRPETVFEDGFVTALKTYCEENVSTLVENDDNCELRWHRVYESVSTKYREHHSGRKIILSPAWHPVFPPPSSRLSTTWGKGRLSKKNWLEIAHSLALLNQTELLGVTNKYSGNQPHVLRPVAAVAKPSVCAACSGMLWTFGSPAVVCDRCTLVAHRQCQAKVAKINNCKGGSSQNPANPDVVNPHPASPPQVVMYRSDLINSSSQQFQSDAGHGGSSSIRNSSHSGTLPGASRFMMCGSLYKRGQLLHGLTRRFYVLDLASQRIVYYESQSEVDMGPGAERGSISLTQICDVVPMEQQQGSSYDDGTAVEFGFTINTTKRSHQFLTASKKECDRWIEAIGKALTLL